MVDIPHADQLSLFTDAGPGLAAKGIEQVLDHAGEDWVTSTMARLVPWLKCHAEYCADDLWRDRLMAYEPLHPNAIGALTRRLIERGYLASPPLRRIYSRRDLARNREIRVYRSRVFGRS
jgi:hypothetical protein